MKEVASAAGSGTLAILIASYVFGVASGIAIAVLAMNLLT